MQQVDSNQNKCQSIMVIGGITANWGYGPHSSPSCRGPEPLSNAVLLGTMPNGISFRPTAVAGCMSVADRQTDRQTDHAQIHLSQ